MLDVQQLAMPNGYSVVRPRGELDALNVSSFRRALGDVAGMEGLVIDLSGVCFIDSAGIGAMVGGIRRAREGGIDVAVACSRPGLARVLQAAGIDTLVDVFGTFGEAVEALAKHEPPPGG